MKVVYRVLLQSSLSLCLALSAQALKAAPQTPIVLWPGGAPGPTGREPLDTPTLLPYLPPKEKATGAAIIVCPGGCYSRLADHEGGPVAEWLNTLGIAAFVLKYRIGPRYRHPAPLQDAEVADDRYSKISDDLLRAGFVEKKRVGSRGLEIEPVNSGGPTITSGRIKSCREKSRWSRSPAI